MTTERKEIYHLYDINKDNLNFILQRIGDRLDNIEGLSGNINKLVFPSSTYANLPTGAKANQIQRITDKCRGLWFHNGTEWISLTGEVFNVVEFGCKGNDSYDCTNALKNMVVEVNQYTGLNKPTIYFPHGTYRINSGVIPNITCNVYGPDATIGAIPSAQDTNYLLSVDYHSTIGQFFVLRAIHGADYGGTTPYNCGLQIDGSDNSFYRIAQLELLDTGISLAGGVNDRHIAQNVFDIQTVMSCNKCFNLTSGTDIQCEANTFNVEYMRPGILNAIGIYITNDNYYTCNNVFNINVTDIHLANGEVAINIAGSTPANILYNIFNFISGLSTPHDGGKYINIGANTGVNCFNMCAFDTSLMTWSSRQIFNGGIAPDWTNGRSVIFSTSAPASGYWAVGDKFWDNDVEAGGSPGSICTTAGSPGTWKAMASLAA